MEQPWFSPNWAGIAVDIAQQEYLSCGAQIPLLYYRMLSADWSIYDFEERGQMLASSRAKGELNVFCLWIVY